VDGLRGAHEDLLRDASSQCARAAERARIDHRDGPPGLATPRGNRRGDTGAHDHEVEPSLHGIGFYRGAPVPDLSNARVGAYASTPSGRVLLGSALAQLLHRQIFSVARDVPHVAVRICDTPEPVAVELILRGPHERGARGNRSFD